jgi:hypothetical protein
MISASTGSTTIRDDELVGQIACCLHRSIIPENWFFCQLTLKSTQIAEKEEHDNALPARLIIGAVIVAAATPSKRFKELVSALRGKPNQILSPRRRPGPAQHGCGYA